MDDNISNIINRYKTHPSILKITENVILETKFKFSDITEEKMFNKNQRTLSKYL